MKLKDLIAHDRNPRKISDEKLNMLKKSLAEFGDLGGIVYNLKTKRLIGGHQRLKVLPPETTIYIDAKQPGHGYIELNGDRFTCRFVKWDEAKEKAAMIAANQHGGEWDLPILSNLINDLDALNIDMDLLGFGQEELEKLMAPIHNLNSENQAEAEKSVGLSDRFMIPPFSVLNAREGWWQDRKRQWIALGIKSELGRGEALPPGGSTEPLARFKAGEKSTWNPGKQASKQEKKRAASKIKGN